MPFDNGDIPPLPDGVQVFGDAVGAGTDQLSATRLTALNTVIRSCPPGAGVILVQAPQFLSKIVNATATPLRIWPQPGQILWPANARDQPVILKPAHAAWLSVLTDRLAYRMLAWPLVAPRRDRETAEVSRDNVSRTDHMG